ncbi:hypothetical protein Tco_1262522 [Tanacetum coccineum]
MSTYLKNMVGYKHNQLKSKSYEEIQKLFDNEMRRVNTFIPIDSEVVKSKTGQKEKFKKERATTQKSSMRTKIGVNKETDNLEVVKEDDDEAELKKHLVIVKE